jgi:hypothetical protein
MSKSYKKRMEIRDEREEERELLSTAKEIIFEADPRFDFSNSKNRSIVYKTKNCLK